MATTTYDVLYSVPVPGLDTRAMAIATVTVGDLGAYITGERDIPKIIETRRGYSAGDVTVVQLKRKRIGRES
jgi:hypothetical protein